MRFYVRSKVNKITSLNRCFFDAQKGRIELAIERIKDLHEEFPEDSEIYYAEGLIRADYLGQGIKAQSLFAKAYEYDNKHSFAAFNATAFAKNEEEFQKWAEIAEKVSPNDKDIIPIKHIIKELNRGIPYHEIIFAKIEAHEEVGKKAAFMEILPLIHDLGINEAEFHRHRAQNLRILDRDAYNTRYVMGEAFLPEERLALHEAIDELEKAIHINEYDPELWNLKSAWSLLMEEYKESIKYADKAIELRPFDYPKPYHNKAASLWGLKSDEKALECAKESLKQAKSANSIEDITRSEDMIKDFSRPRITPNLDDTMPLIQQITNSAALTSDQELGQQGNFKITFDDLVKGIIQKSPRSDKPVDYLQMVAELLSDFTPETFFRIVVELYNKDKKVRENFMNASLYVVAFSNKVMQRDTARFLALLILDSYEIKGIYRKGILEPSAVPGKFYVLNKLVRKELKRINPVFPELIADQEPISPPEKQRAIDTIISKFDGAPSQFNSQFKYLDYKVDYEKNLGKIRDMNPKYKISDYIVGFFSIIIFLVVIYFIITKILG